MNKRLLQIVLSFVFSFLTVWGCLEAMSPQIEAVDKSTAAASSLVFWHDLAPGVEATALQDLIGDFNASNPYSITVLGVYAGDTDAIRQQVIDGLRTGGPLPNIVTAYPSSLAEFARYGGIRFLDGYVKDPAVGITNTADFYPEVLSAFRLGEFADQLAGLPYGRSLELMYYNSRLLAGAGITVPTTWDAFESACVTMTSPTVSGTVIDAAGYAHFTNWLWSRGGMLLSGDLRRARFDEAAGIDSLLLFRRLMDGGYARRAVWTNEQFDAFLYGQAGFLFENSRGIEYLYTISEGTLPFTWGVAHVPADSGQERVASFGTGLGILRHNDSIDRDAWLFIRWLADKQQTARWAGITGEFPVRISATSHPSVTHRMANQPKYAQAINLLSLGRSEPSIRGTPAMHQEIAGAVNAILGQGAQVTTTLRSAAGNTDAVLAATVASTAVIPPWGGTLVHTGTGGISATIEIPAGSVDVTSTFSFAPVDNLPAGGPGFALLPEGAFTQTVTVTLGYSDTAVAGMVEEDLRLFNYSWATGTWQDAAPCHGFVIDPLRNRFSAGLCHFSDYALTVSPNKAFLPAVLKK